MKNIEKFFAKAPFFVKYYLKSSFHNVNIKETEIINLVSKVIRRRIWRIQNKGFSKLQ